MGVVECCRLVDTDNESDDWWWKDAGWPKQRVKNVWIVQYDWQIEGTDPNYSASWAQAVLW